MSLTGSEEADLIRHYDTEPGHMPEHRIYSMSFGSVYPHYIAKAERQGRTAAEVDELIEWLTGYDDAALKKVIIDGTDFRTFFAEAPALNPDRERITGVICGVRVEEIEDPLMQDIRYLDKIVDELARGKGMDKIKRA